MALSFEKYHGIGNDFIVTRVAHEADISIERAIQLCDRHFGVGADGVLLVGPPRSAHSVASMHVINADGSTPEMCGNGLRCVAFSLSRHDVSLGCEYVVDTDSGPLSCAIDVKGTVALVGTDIGRGSPLGKLKHNVMGVEQSFSRISTGNPHAICFHEPISSQELDTIGPSISSKIEGGANVEIATQISPTEIHVTVWERGVGRTLACGTGAAATAIAAVSEGRSPSGVPLTVRLPGGLLEITVDADLRAHLKGPAAWIYSGTTHL